MIRHLYFCAFLALLPLFGFGQTFGIVIHGGAGNGINPEQLKGEKAEAYDTALNNAIRFGYSLLEDGMDAVSVVEAVIVELENNPLFNAGLGAVANANNEVFHDASIMRGSDLNAGAVANVFGPKNPIQAAIAVMDKSKHVLLSGRGAEAFSASQNVRMLSEADKTNYIQAAPQPKVSKKGTVGCVVLDMYGDLAAGTSTGGTAKKLPGRVGDSPIIGAGTWADNRSCAVSATGDGEYFIRTGAAQYVGSSMRMLELDLQTAIESSIVEIDELGGEGGLIGIDKHGNIGWHFNTKGMFRAAHTSEMPKPLVEMFSK
ncbi:MAG: isoaspartyl peptidase/L-asparaginase [Cryomorphaceae bacterium]|nr:isoaspartyl peptidase/L-asparaginase [Cryomorphaceae bacterium]